MKYQDDLTLEEAYRKIAEKELLSEDVKVGDHVVGIMGVDGGYGGIVSSINRDKRGRNVVTFIDEVTGDKRETFEFNVQSTNTDQGKKHYEFSKTHSPSKVRKFTEGVQEEGLWDRVKGTASGVGKAVSNVADIGNETSKFGGKGGFIDKVGQQFKGGRSSSVIKSHLTKLNAEIDDFINDVKKVGNVTADSEANYAQTAEFLKGIIRKIAKTAGTGKVSVSSLKSSLGQAGFLAPEKEESSEV